MTAVASAPAKIILFGEHAVVAGAPAIGTAVDLRARVRVEELSGRVDVDLRGIGLSLEGFTVDPWGKLVSVGSSVEAEKAARFVSAVLDEFQARSLRVVIESEIPVAAGLGSSAAIVVASIGALSHYLGLELSREKVASLAFRLERSVQKGLGSPMDTSLATFGGYRLVSDGTQALDLPALELMVGCTGTPHETQSEVAKVQMLKSQFPEIVDPLFSSIGSITKRAIPCIRDLRLQELGQLMNMNHGLLEALGVGTRELSELVYAARGAGGALGAKITGAGGGGCMFALPKKDGSLQLSTAITLAKGKAFSVFSGAEGLRIESEQRT